MTIKNKQSLMEQFRSRCKEHGMRITPQRTMIYKELLNSTDHPSPEQIFERLKRVFPEISFDTVYRSLSSFNQIGLIDQVDGFGTAKRFDANPSKHHHFRCRKCGVIVDFQSDYYNNIAISKDINKKREVLKLRVTLEGFCAKCRKKPKV